MEGTLDYDVEVAFRRRVVGVYCSCPYFDDGNGVCKHLWATLRYLENVDLIPEGSALADFEDDTEGPSSPVANEASSHSTDDEEDDWLDDDERLELASREPLDEEQPEWAGRLEALRALATAAQSAMAASSMARTTPSDEGPASAVTRGGSKLYYLLIADAGPSEILQIQIVARKYLADGGLGVARAIGAEAAVKTVGPNSLDPNRRASLLLEVASQAARREVASYASAYRWRYRGQDWQYPGSAAAGPVHVPVAVVDVLVPLLVETGELRCIQAGDDFSDPERFPIVRRVDDRVWLPRIRFTEEEKPNGGALVETVLVAPNPKGDDEERPREADDVLRLLTNGGGVGSDAVRRSSSCRSRSCSTGRPRRPDSRRGFGSPNIWGRNVAIRGKPSCRAT